MLNLSSSALFSWQSLFAVPRDGFGELLFGGRCAHLVCEVLVVEDVVDPRCEVVSVGMHVVCIRRVVHRCQCIAEFDKTGELFAVCQFEVFVFVECGVFGEGSARIVFHRDGFADRFDDVDCAEPEFGEEFFGFAAFSEVVFYADAFDRDGMRFGQQLCDRAAQPTDVLRFFCGDHGTTPFSRSDDCRAIEWFDAG